MSAGVAASGKLADDVPAGMTSAEMETCSLSPSLSYVEHTDVLAAGSAMSSSLSISGATSQVNHSLQFIYLNLQHSKNATAVLCKQLSGHNNAIAFVLEPWIYQDKILGFGSSHASVYCRTNEPVARSCILVKGVQAYSLPQYGDRDTTTVRVTCKLRNKTIIVVSLYMAYDENTPSVMLEKLYRYCSEQHLPLIVASNTNSHHHAWGCNEADRRGH